MNLECAVNENFSARAGVAPDLTQSCDTATAGEGVGRGPGGPTYASRKPVRLINARILLVALDGGANF